nr:ribonuclease H-like domain-containing protein [Tanacetum cinerariifolium]
MIDYSLWEVILNGDSPAATRVIEGVVQPVAPSTTEQMLARKNELKACDTLLMALPDKHHLKIYEAEVKSSSSASTSTQNIAFVSFSNTGSTNEPVSVAASVSAVSAKIPISALPNVDTFSNAVIYSFFASQSTSLQLDNDDLKQIDADDLEEIDLKWQMAMSPKDTRRNGAAEPQRRNVLLETSKSNALVSQCDGLVSVKARLLVYQQNETFFEEDIKLLKLKVQLIDNALVVLRQKLEKAGQERDDLKLKLEKFQTFSKNLSQLLASQTNDKTGLGYNTQVFTRFMFDCDDYFTSKSDESFPASPIYDRYQSGDGYHVVPPPYAGTFMLPKSDLFFHDAPNVNETAHTAFNIELSPTKPDKDFFVQPTEQVKTPRPSVKTVETSILAANTKTIILKPTSNGNRRNRKACFVCKSLDHLIKDCDFYEKKMAQTSVRNHAHRGNHQHYARMTLTNPQKHVVPTAVLTKSELVPITTAVTKSHVTRPRPVKPIVTKPYSPPRRHINRSLSPKANNFPPTVTVVKVLQGNPYHTLKDGGVIDSECSRHMTGNMSYLSDFKELNGGFVALVVIQRVMCNKKNSVLFTDSEYLVLSLEFKLPDENQVLLRVPRENNMYNVDLKNIVPSRDLTCLFAKAKLDESNLWHRRLGHINFNTMNKLVKGIKREFSVPRTPQQNGIAERKNRTLIDAAKTMLADSLLPVLFWAEAVNTACYVQNRVLVTKPQNKTPYELLHGRTPVVKHLEDSTVEPKETLHINFLENNPNVVEKAGEESVQQYVLFSVWSSGSPNPQNTDDDAAFKVKESKFKGKKPYINEVNAIDSPVPAVGQICTNNTKTFSAAGPSNTIVSPTHRKSSYVYSSQLPDDPNMPELEDITYFDDEEDVATQTRSMTRVAKDQGRLSQINNDDFHTCMFACFLSQEEPKRVHQALKDPRWIEAIQEELLRFKMQKVWVLVDLPHGKRAIEEGIDYEEVFAPVARIEAIRLFLAYSIFMGFMVYQMDVKSVFLHRTIDEEKQDGIFISQDKYVAKILRKFGLTYGKSANTPIDIEKPLLKDPDG